MSAEERFVNVTVLGDQVAADRACATLEEAGIPVLIEHLRTADISLKHGYRLLTPARFSQTAMHLLSLKNPGGMGQQAA